MTMKVDFFGPDSGSEATPKQLNMVKAINRVKDPHETAGCMTKGSALFGHSSDFSRHRATHHSAMIALGSAIGTGIFVLPNVGFSSWLDIASRFGSAVGLVFRCFSGCIPGCTLLMYMEYIILVSTFQMNLDYYELRSRIKDPKPWPRPRFRRCLSQRHRAFDNLKLSITQGAIIYIFPWPICGPGKHGETTTFQELIKGAPVQTLVAYIIVGAFITATTTVMLEIFAMGLLSYPTSTRYSPVFRPKRRLGNALLSSMKVAVLSVMALILVPSWFGSTSSLLRTMQIFISNDPYYILCQDLDFNDNTGSLYKPMMRSADSMQDQHLLFSGFDRDFWTCIERDVVSEKLVELYWSEAGVKKFSEDSDLLARISQDAQKHRLLSSIARRKMSEPRWTSMMRGDRSRVETLNQVEIIQSTGILLDGYGIDNSDLFPATPLSKSASSSVLSLPSKSQLADSRLETTYISTNEAKSSISETKIKISTQRQSFSPHNERTSESSEVQESSEQSYITVKPNTRLLFKYKLASVTISGVEDSSTQEHLNHIQGKRRNPTPPSSSECMVNCGTTSAPLTEVSSLILK